MQNPIKGLLFYINTGTSEPVCYKATKIWTSQNQNDHEICKKKVKNIIEDEDRTYGALIVLSVKLCQNMHIGNNIHSGYAYHFD